MARFDYQRARAIGAWPLRELLIAYVALVRERTAEGFRHQQLLFQLRAVFGGDKDVPQIPPILRETNRQ